MFLILRTEGAGTGGLFLLFMGCNWGTERLFLCIGFGVEEQVAGALGIGLAVGEQGGCAWTGGDDACDFCEVGRGLGRELH